MNRLGMSFEEAEWLAGQPPAERGDVVLLMSHLACADTPDHPLNARQMAAFRALRGLFPGVPASLANSSGIFLGPDALNDMVRPGVALYGANPTPLHLNPMRPVVDLKGSIVQVRAGRAKAKPSATARPGRRGGRRASPSCRSAMPTASCAPPARATSGPARKRSSPAAAARSPASSRWISSPST